MSNSNEINNKKNNLNDQIFSFEDVKFFKNKIENNAKVDDRKLLYTLASLIISLSIFIIAGFALSKMGLNISKDSHLNDVKQTKSTDTVKDYSHTTEKEKTNESTENTKIDGISGGFFSTKKTENSKDSASEKLKDSASHFKDWDEFYEEFPHSPKIKIGSTQKEVKLTFGTPEIIISFNDIDYWNYKSFVLEFDSETKEVVDFQIK